MTMFPNTANCVKCDQELAVGEPGSSNVIGMVNAGLIFRATGNFGSAIFDPSEHDPPAFIEIVVCDDCAADMIVTVEHDAPIIEPVLVRMPLSRYSEKEAGQWPKS